LCRECGTKIREGYIFCGGCGRNATEERKIRKKLEKIEEREKKNYW
jgi:uncharacterized membrane protein YvbJ